MSTLVEEIAAFVENWSDAPPNPCGRRAQLARDIRRRFGTSEADLLAACCAFRMWYEQSPQNLFDAELCRIANFARSAITKATKPE